MICIADCSAAARTAMRHSVPQLVVGRDHHGSGTWTHSVVRTRPAPCTTCLQHSAHPARSKLGRQSSHRRSSRTGLTSRVHELLSRHLGTAASSAPRKAVAASPGSAPSPSPEPEAPEPQEPQAGRDRTSGAAAAEEKLLGAADKELGILLITRRLSLVDTALSLAVVVVSAQWPFRAC